MTRKSDLTCLPFSITLVVVPQALMPSKSKRIGPRSLETRPEKLAKKWQEGIVTKCHPAVFEIAKLLKERTQAALQLGPNPSPEIVGEIRSKFYNDFEEIRQRYARKGLPFGCPDCGLTVAPAILGDASPGNTSGWHWLADVLHFLRYRVPLRVDLAKRAQGDWEATRRTLETEQRFEKIRCGKIRSPARFKGIEEHLLIFIMLWGLGIEELTREELADFFDWCCPCGSDSHSPDALKNQRVRFQKALENCPTWTPLPHVHRHPSPPSVTGPSSEK